MMKKCVSLVLSLMLILCTLPCGLASDLGTNASGGTGVAIPLGTENRLMSALVGDTFYSITESNLGIQLKSTVLGSERTDTIARDSSLQTLSALFAWNDGLYGLSVQKDGWFRLLDDQGALVMEQQPLELDLSGVKDSSGEAAAFRTLFAQDGFLYYLVDQSYDPDSTAGRISLTDGKKQSFAIENLKQLIPYENGKVLVFTQNFSEIASPDAVRAGQCAVYDAQTRSLGTCWDIPTKGLLESFSIGGFCYGNGSLFFTKGSCIQGLNLSTGEFRISGYTGDGLFSSDSRTSAAYVNGSYLTYGVNGVKLLPLDSPELKNGALRIFGEMGSAAHKSFLKNYPEIPVEVGQDFSASIEAITQAMMTDGNPYDVLLLLLNQMPVENLVRKGYAADLSGDQELKSILDQMYPIYAQVLQKDGKLYGVPVEVMISGLGVNIELWESLGLTQDDLPATCPEFLDFAANWVYDYGEDHPEIDLFNIGQSSSMVFTHVMNAYVAYMQSKGSGELHFNTPEFRALLEGFKTVDFAEIDSFRDGSFISAQDKALFTLGIGVTPEKYDRQTVTPLYLSIARGEQPVVAVSLQLMIINPKTTRMDAALTYMKNYLNNLPAQTANITLFPEHNDPVELPGYQRSLDEANALLEDAQKRLETVSAEYKAEVQDSIRTAESNIAELEKNPYSVTAEDIQRYREEVQPKVFVQQQNPMSSGDNQATAEINTLISQYLTGAITADKMITELDNRLRLMTLENR